MAEKYLIVVDVQNDFVTGTLGTKEAENILPCIRGTKGWELAGRLKDIQKS